MSIRSAPRSFSSSAPPHRILEVLYHSLETALTRECEQRHDANVVLRRLDADADEILQLNLRLECRGLLHIPIHLRARPTNDNIYEVQCALDDGSSRRFSYGLSRRSGKGLSPAPCLGRKLATFLLDAFEKRLGRRLLQSPARPPRQTASALS